MSITEQEFADAVIGYVESSATSLDVDGHETQVPDIWTYRAEASAMSGMICLAGHGIFTEVYDLQNLIPTKWRKFCEEFYSPAARLLMLLLDQCERATLATWDPADDSRDHFPMTRHFYSYERQDRTFAALRRQLEERGLVTQPTRTYRHDANAFSVVFPDRTIDFPGSYGSARRVRDELLSGTEYEADMPRGIELYGSSVPVLHMAGNTVERSESELDRLVAEGTYPAAPKAQNIVYAMSGLKDGDLIARYIGRMNVSALEIAYGSLAGKIHWDIDYLVPNDLSFDEERSLDCSEANWSWHQANILSQSPAIAEALASNNRQ